ncbi:helix-turn-helix domain-containing protein [Mycobacterium sp. CVI_P3]|uniref:Helix-turn-helix domain-containing protein n=1 Tax=Mycobacterium pinniadriaticum TaxID=2994102 RepID=A0ABT3SAE8_9MYCO|nr:helix-turn-helix domain-containing protein [Mycobacterium pinniadriaticum]MCX2929466.1 helix-turn-helix domain-containing protein [Mycobacterium pinniadriaticum]MCX2935890.1 helix-turn-helix domain-containing protein [Mycobacterium pinniadriaticum]
MPLGADYPGQDCSIARSLEVVGERWTLLILRDAFHGLTRFDEFQRSLGVASNILSVRLNKLVDLGILQTDDTDAVGRRRGYHLTEKGAALNGVLIEMMQWGDRFEPSSSGPTTIMVHDECGRAVSAEHRCSCCGGIIAPENTHLAPAPQLRGPDGRPLSRTLPQLAAWGPASE